MTAIDLTGPNLKYKYRRPKPKGRFRADYNGNTGKNRHKHLLLPMVHSIKRKELVRRYVTLGKKKR